MGKRKKAIPVHEGELVGLRAEPITPLYERCLVCERVAGKLSDGVTPCVCFNGFVQTAYTTQRMDAMVTENDRLLLLLDALLTDTEEDGTAITITRFLASRKEELEAARSRTRLKGEEDG